jgi:hypothetical protein
MQNLEPPYSRTTPKTTRSVTRCLCRSCGGFGLSVSFCLCEECVLQLYCRLRTGLAPISTLYTEPVATAKVLGRETQVWFRSLITPQTLGTLGYRQDNSVLDDKMEGIGCGHARRFAPPLVYRAGGRALSSAWPAGKNPVRPRQKPTTPSPLSLQLTPYVAAQSVAASRSRMLCRLTRCIRCLLSGLPLLRVALLSAAEWPLSEIGPAPRLPPRCWASYGPEASHLTSAMLPLVDKCRVARRPSCGTVLRAPT